MSGNEKTVTPTQLREHTPYAQYELVNVTFGDANENLDIRHSLKPPTPEHVLFQVVSSTAPVHVFRDISSGRKPWREGVIVLQADASDVSVTLLLMVAHKEHPPLWE